METADPSKTATAGGLFSDDDDMFSETKKDEVFNQEILAEAMRRRKLREPKSPASGDQPAGSKIQWEAEPEASTGLPYRVEPVEGKGRGVIAAREIQQGELVEMAHCISIPSSQTIDIQSTVLRDYVFAAPEGGCLLALGVGSLFNHSDDANLEIWMDPSQAQIQFMAKAAVPSGTELTICYTHLPKGYDFTEKSADSLNPFDVGPPQSPPHGGRMVEQTLSPEPRLCESFSVKGFCEKGQRCKFSHEEQRKPRRNTRPAQAPQASQSRAPSYTAGAGYGASYTLSSQNQSAFSL